MGRVLCPICKEWRHIDDQGREDRCWACGWVVPIDKKTEQYLDRALWPPVSRQERVDRLRHADKKTGR